MTNIAIMGSGLMAHALASSWARAGHTITIGSRKPDDKRVSELGTYGVISIHAEALREADVVVLALPFPEIVRFASRNRAFLDGKTVIDPSVPFDYNFDGTLGSSELVAEGLERRTGLVGAFKDNFAAQLAASHEPLTEMNVRLVGDDRHAIALVARLVRDMGHHPIDCGPLHNSRLLDAAACLILEERRRAAHSRTDPSGDGQ